MFLLTYCQLILNIIYTYCVNVDYKTVAWVKRGKTRRDLLKFLSNSKKTLTANEMKNELGLSLSQVSRCLKTLSEKELISCLNPDDNIGKIYRITKKGEEMLHEI